MKSCKIGILGATGVVGCEMRKVLEEYDIPVSELRLLASARSAGGKMPFKGQELVVQEATDEAFAGLDYVLGAVENDMSRRFAPAIKKSGAVYIDNSSAFRPSGSNPMSPWLCPRLTVPTPCRITASSPTPTAAPLSP